MRLCIDCAADISDTHALVKRCGPCTKAYKAECTKRWYGKNRVVVSERNRAKTGNVSLDERRRIDALYKRMKQSMEANND